MVETLILGISITLQFAAAILALRLIRVTGRRRAWGLIAMAVFFMGVRRSITFFRIVSGDLSMPPDLLAETVALTISVLMVLGIAWIAPIFHSIKESAEALHKSEEKYREIFENVRDVFYQTDFDGTITEISPSIARHSGYKREALIGAPFLDFYFDPNDYRELFKRLEEKGEVNDFEARLKVKGGRFIYVSVNAHVVYDVDGKPAATEGTLRDITERKKAQAEKSKLEEQLRRVQKLESIGALAGGIAHDFNNILLPIMGYADMALRSLGKSDPLRQDLEQVLGGARRAKDLVEQILLFSKQSEKELRPVALQDLIKETLKLLRPSIPSTIEIHQRIDASCPKARAEATQIQQVIVNLCANAWQSMEEKGGALTIELEQVDVDAVTARLHPYLDEGEYVRLSVIDTGPGMDETTLERIFEPFFTTKAVDKGTGLGLSVVHGIVRSHKGDILVDTERGRGSTFHVFLPVATTDLDTVQQEPKAIVGGRESILVVDDEEAIAEVIGKMLKRVGYKATVCKGSIEALKAFRLQPDEYDLVISDMTMPDMTGLELSKELLKIRPELLVVVMTGYGDSLSEDVWKACGIKKIIGKPVVMSELALEVREILDG